ncbi:hypothetical protein ACHAP8_010711 [Fusarium lateritium]
MDREGDTIMGGLEPPPFSQENATVLVLHLLKASNILTNLYPQNPSAAYEAKDLQVRTVLDTINAQVTQYHQMDVEQEVDVGARWGKSKRVEKNRGRDKKEEVRRLRNMTARYFKRAYKDAIRWCLRDDREGNAETSSDDEHGPGDGLGSDQSVSEEEMGEAPQVQSSQSPSFRQSQSPERGQGSPAESLSLLREVRLLRGEVRDLKDMLQDKSKEVQELIQSNQILVDALLARDQRLPDRPPSEARGSPELGVDDAAR